MNKTALIAAAAIGLTLGISGCKTHTGKVIKNTPFTDMQKSVAKIGEKGGLAAIGTGQSSDMQIAREKAMMEARKNLAQTITVKVENLQKKFIEEAGDVGKGAEINQLFSSSTKIITSRELMGSMPKQQVMTEEKGLFTAYVLMVVNPKVVADALENQLAAQKAIYARYRASEGFKELGNEVERYEAFQKEMNQMLNN
jgi:SAM-dependent MidA family methyltransferase